MKKQILAIASLGLLLIASPVLAADVASGTLNTGDTLTDATGGGAGIASLAFSPNVKLNYEANSTGTAFEMSGVNSSGTIEYGVYSGTNVVYMHTAPTDATSGDATVTDLSGDTVADASNASVTGWPIMGSSAGSSGGSGGS